MPSEVTGRESQLLLKIGEVARRTGVTLRTIRYYQSLGLIDAAQRTRGGLHLYQPEACDRVQFIRDLRSLRVPLARIRELLRRRKTALTGAEGSRGIAAALSGGLLEIEKRMHQYTALREQMTEALAILESCLECPARPLREVCYACENLSRRDSLPAYIRALVN